MKTFMGISGALLLAASCGASAQSNWYDPHPGKISYSYIEGGYLRGKDLVDRSTGLSQDADGFDVGASFALGAPAFIFGDYRSMDSGEFSALVGGPPPTQQSGKIR
ncbi:MAG TPA: hypothetical protein VHE37_14915, partial [Nevskiaceae bacterium]|nr:hypothetical protein [Nevskiaceae bacterium]